LFDGAAQPGNVVKLYISSAAFPAYISIALGLLMYSLLVKYREPPNEPELALFGMERGKPSNKEDNNKQWPIPLVCTRLLV
jgi:hypothetical protein